MILGGEGIHVTAEAFDSLRDLLCGAALCAFEEQMLEKMREAHTAQALHAGRRSPPRSRR
jgi:hypothetical protein